MFTLPENVHGHGRARAFGTIWHSKSWATRRESGILVQSCQKSIKADFRLAQALWHVYAICLNKYAIGARRNF